jgi:phage gp36-like protein
MSVTVTELRERIDEQVLAQLTDPNGTTVDNVKLIHALKDALGQIGGYLYPLSEADRPPETTLDTYQVDLALYKLAGNRPGVEFDSIRARAKDALTFFASLTGLRREALEFETDAPTPQIGTTDLDLFQGKVTA